MMRLIMDNFGPISHVDLLLDRKINIIIGEQATGKSTIAKTVYFCRKIKDYLVEYTLNMRVIHQTISPIASFNRLITNHFMGCFGTTKHLTRPFSIYFNFNVQEKDRYVRITLIQDGRIKIDFSKKLYDGIGAVIITARDYFKNSKIGSGKTITSFIEKQRQFTNILEGSIRGIVSNLFCDESDTLYIPAGRSLLSLLPERLSKLQLSEMDLPMTEFIDRIQTTKSAFNTRIPDLIKYYTDVMGNEINEIDVKYAYNITKQILRADYVVDNEGEKLYYNNTHWVKLLYGSSGQQESLWILMLMFLVILEKRKSFIVLEEPEAHLYPESQRYMVEMISLMVNSTNSEVFLTTHSPYILTSYNLLIHSGIVESSIPEHNSIIEENIRAKENTVNAFQIKKGEGSNLESLIDDSSGMIKSYEIDRISSLINKDTDALLDLEVKYDL